MPHLPTPEQFADLASSGKITLNEDALRPRDGGDQPIPPRYSELLTAAGVPAPLHMQFLVDLRAIIGAVMDTTREITPSKTD